MNGTPPQMGDLELVLQPLAAPSDSTRTAFLVIVCVVILERLFEMWLSRRNARRVLARGGHEVGAGHYPVMVLLHTGFFVAVLAEVWWLPTWPTGWLTAAAVIAVAASMMLRYWAISSLGDRWNTRVIVEPQRAPVVGGPYRWFKHPNYVAVVLELFALPLIHGAWRTAIVVTALNALLLRHRIRVEEAAVYGSGRDSDEQGGVR